MNDSIRPVMMKIEADKPCLSAEKSESIVMTRPTTPGSILPRANGVNILQTSNTMQSLRDKLSNCGIAVERILHFIYSDGSAHPRLLYCKTVYGQYVMVEPPEDLISYGDLTLLDQRVDVVVDDILKRVRVALNDIYTGYTYITPGGIHYKSDKNSEPRFFAYGKIEDADKIFDFRDHQYHLIPAVHWSRLIEPARLNHLEAYISSVHAASPLDQIVQKAKLTPLLTSSGPMTFFAPSDQMIMSHLIRLDPDKLRSILLAHIVPDRLVKHVGDDQKVIPESKNGLVAASDVPSLSNSVEEWTALSQNKFQVHRVNGSIVGIVSLPDKMKIRIIGDGVQKYNGVIYRIESILTPVAQNVNIPTSSDFDNVVTVFDISTSTMYIRNIQYQMIMDRMPKLIRNLEHIHQKSVSIMEEIRRGAHVDGQQLLNDSNVLMRLFFSREVPCDKLCVEMDKLAEKVAEENHQFDRFIKAGSRFSSLKVPVETLWLEVSRAEQILHVESPISNVHELEEC